MTSSEVNKSMLALKWQDKRSVNMLSTCTCTIHDDSRGTKSRRTRLVSVGIKEVEKPAMVDKYNAYMGWVDKDARSTDVVLWVQPSYYQAVETCFISNLKARTWL